jgi:hypothetical protein
MNKIRIFLLLLLLTGPSHADESEDLIALVGADDNNNSVTKIISGKDYEEKVSKIITEFRTSTVPVVTAERGESKSSKWKMKKFSIGLGLAGEIGIGPWKIGSEVKQRIFFVKK